MSHCLNLLFKDFFPSHPLPLAEPTASYLVSSAALYLILLQLVLQTHFKKLFRGCFLLLADFTSFEKTQPTWAQVLTPFLICNLSLKKSLD